MDTGEAADDALTARDYEALATFRRSLRRFLAVSDSNARAAGLTPQQHQTLLAICGGFPGEEEVSIGLIADHLMLKNHSAVELIGRLARAGLVERSVSTQDRRRVLVRLTRQGRKVLAEVSEGNLRELRQSKIVLAELISRLEALDRELPGPD